MSVRQQGLNLAADNPSVTQPRFIVPGRTCFITARAVRRMFMFAPTRDVVRLLEYLLAVAAKAYGMSIHEVLCMSNHFHILLTDVHGRLPDFMHYLDTMLARSLNALRGSSGSVFEEEYGLVVETDDESVIAHAVYTLANPCAAHLVKRSRQWPGFSTLQMEYGQTVQIERPKIGLWKDDVAQRPRKRPRAPGREARCGKPSRLPDFVEFTLERPPVRPELHDAELRADIRRRLETRELELIERRRREGREVLGRRAVLAQRWDAFPTGAEELFGARPRVAGRLWSRGSWLQRIQGFLDAYRLARTRFLAGEMDVVWPFGTWAMRVRFELACETAPP